MCTVDNIRVCKFQFMIHGRQKEDVQCRCEVQSRVTNEKKITTKTTVTNAAIVITLTPEISTAIY